MDFMTLAIAGLAKGSIYALVAIGIVLIYNTLDMINFAHGEIFAYGAFAGYFSFRVFGWPFPLALLTATVAGAVVGVLLHILVLRRVVNEAHMTLVMVTVGVFFALKGGLRLIAGSDTHTMPRLFQENLRIGDVIVSPESLITIVIMISASIVFTIFLKKTRLGRQMRATQQNSVGASIVGIDTDRVFIITLALAASIASFGGALAAPVILLYPDMGTAYLMKGFAAATLGGLESLVGAAIAGLLVGVIEMLFGGLVSSILQEISAPIIIMVVLLFRPQGLFGSRQIQRV